MGDNLEGFLLVNERPSRWKCAFEHNSNPLHVYCKLIRLGFKKTGARKICSFYESHFHKYFTRKKDNFMQRGYGF